MRAFGGLVRAAPRGSAERRWRTFEFGLCERMGSVVPVTQSVGLRRWRAPALGLTGVLPIRPGALAGLAGRKCNARYIKIRRAASGKGDFRRPD